MADPVAPLKRTLWAEIDHRRDELARLCADSLRVPAENPAGDTRAIADHYTGVLERAGLPVERFVADMRGGLTASLFASVLLET
ncbi:MAG: hypothetical protein ACRELA_08795 [Candidatus Rokuibacteriota bacterium]